MAVINAREDLRAQIALAQSIGGNIGYAAGAYTNEKRREAALFMQKERREAASAQLAKHVKNYDGDIEKLYRNVKNLKGDVDKDVYGAIVSAYTKSLFGNIPTKKEYFIIVEALSNPLVTLPEKQRRAYEAMAERYERANQLSNPNPLGLTTDNLPTGTSPLDDEPPSRPDQPTEADLQQYRDLGVPPDKMPGPKPEEKPPGFGTKVWQSMFPPVEVREQKKSVDRLQGKADEFLDQDAITFERKHLIKDAEPTPDEKGRNLASDFARSDSDFGVSVADPSAPTLIKQITEIEKSNLPTDEKVAAMVDAVSGKQEERKGVTATNPETGEKIITYDGGKTWQKLQ